MHDNFVFAPEGKTTTNTLAIQYVITRWAWLLASMWCKPHWTQTRGFIDDHFETWANENTLLLYYIYNVKIIIMFLCSLDFSVIAIPCHCHVDPKLNEINIYLHISIDYWLSSLFTQHTKLGFVKAVRCSLYPREILTSCKWLHQVLYLKLCNYVAAKQQ